MAQAEASAATSVLFEASSERVNVNAGLTVHVVGRLTPAVLSILRPAIDAVSISGGPQVLIVIDDAYSRSHLREFPADITLVLVPDHPSYFQRIGRLHSHLAEVTRHTTIGALHLHGVLPALSCARAVRASRDSNIEVFFFPHSSRALTGLAPLRAAILGTIRLLLRRTQQHAIFNVPTDANLAHSFAPGNEAKMIESAVADVFFRTPRHEARQPLLISIGRDESPLPAANLMQLAVLMGDESLGLSFNWIGPATDLTLGAFRAAGIGQFPGSVAEERAQRLGAGWIYVAAAPERGFPIGLVEAMAAGLPCVAIDSPNHGHVMRHGVTGFLCKDQIDMVNHIAKLVDSVDLRRQIGDAAREEAHKRFSDAVFRERLLSPPVGPRVADVEH